MKTFLTLLAGAAALSVFAEKLPVDEDIFLQQHTSFSCERHKQLEEDLLKAPAKNYPFPENKIIWDKGMPVIVSDGTELTMLSSQIMSATNGNPLSARQLREAGINVFVVDVNYVQSKNIYSRKNPRSTDPAKVFKTFATNAKALLASAPDAKIIIRIWASYEGDDFKQLYPDALIAEPNGNTKWKNGEQRANYLNEWKLYLAERVRKFLELVGDSQYAKNIVGVHIGAMNTGEWWYYKDGVFFWDYSKTRQEAFKNFLYAKYGEAKFPELIKRYNAKDREDLFRLPTREERRKSSLRPNTRVSDYYQVLNLPVTNAAQYLAKVIKTVSNGKLLAGVEILTGLNTMNVNGSVFINQLLNCPDLDMLSAPSPYPLRQAGGFSPNRAVNSSIQKHKKIFLAEEDFRTHSVYGTPAGQGQPAPTPQKSAQQFRRQGTSAILKGYNGYLMEFGGRWFTHPEFRREITRLNNMRDVVRKFGSERKAEIAVVSDQEGQLYGNYFANPTEIRDKSLPFIGADYDFYELNDFLDPAVFSKYKMVLFLNLRALGERERSGIDKIKSGGRSLVFLYDAGAVDLTYAAPDSLKNAENLTSIKMVNHPDKAKWGNVSLKSNEENIAKHLGISGKELNFGVRNQVQKGALAAVDPVSFHSGTNLYSWAIADKDAIPLATSANGGVRFGIKKHKDWTAYYSSSTSLPANIIRAIAANAGCHIKNSQGDVVFERAEFTSLHTAFKGKHIITFPTSDEVLECFSGKVISLKNKQYEFEADRGLTFMFYQGKDIDKVKAEIAALAEKHQQWHSDFVKKHPSPKATPGWIYYTQHHIRPKKNGPLPFRSFVAPAILMAGPFDNFDEIVAKLPEIKEVKRMVKEPAVPKRSVYYGNLSSLLQTIPAKKADNIEWQAFNSGTWCTLSSFGISKGQSGLFSFYAQAPKDTDIYLLFAADCPASLAVNSSIISDRKEMFYQKITLKKGFNLISIAAENTSGEGGFTLKFFAKKPTVDPTYQPAYGSCNWTLGKVYLQKD